jgi:sec-independent protein translocase protein TatA
MLLLSRTKTYQGQLPSFLQTTNVATPTNTLQRQSNRASYPFLQKQRRSAGTVQLMSFFGLGLPEIAIILVAAAFLLGPRKIAELGRDAGKMTKELKKVPEEFQKGLEEGEIEARSKRAKLMENIADSGGEEKDV